MSDPILSTLMNYDDSVTSIQDSLLIQQNPVDGLSISFTSTQFCTNLTSNVLMHNGKTESIDNLSQSHGNCGDQVCSGSCRRKAKVHRNRGIKVICIDVKRKRKRRYIKNATMCFKCCVEFPNLQKHFSEYHHLYDCFQCEICHCFKQSKISLMKHQMKHFHMDDDSRDTVTTLDNSILCKICKTQFSSIVVLQHHMESNVCSWSSFFCNFCKETVADAATFEKHLLKHLPITCPVCFLTFKDLQSYKLHSMEHTTEKIHAIESSTASSSKPLFASDYIEKSLIKNWKEQQRHSCEYCAKTFTRLLDLDRHKFLHNGIAPWTCPKCKETFLTSTKYKEHYITAHENTKQPFFCGSCDKRFSSAERLRAHERAHSGIKPFQCTVCGKGFTQRGNLKDHLLTHSTERPWKCEQCSKAFKIKGDLTKHMIVHKGTKDFECSYCQKAFSRQSYLRRHLRIHTGEKPYVCDICNKAFSRSENCQEHRRIHTGERPFVCHCGATFKDSGNFCNHKKIHNNDPKKRKKVTKSPLDQSSSVNNPTTTHDGFDELSSAESMNDGDSCSKPEEELSPSTDQRTDAGELTCVVPFLSNDKSVDDVSTTQFVVQLENPVELERYDKNVLCQTQIMTLSLDDPRLADILRSTNIHGSTSESQLTLFNTDQSHLTFLDNAQSELTLLNNDQSQLIMLNQSNLMIAPLKSHLTAAPSSGDFLSG